MQSANLIFGRVGWPHPDWDAVYFPQDLPSDWQFSYYSNDADCLLLPASDCRALDAQQAQAFCEDMPEGFRFYLEAPCDGFAAGVIDALSEHIGAILVQQRVPEWRDVPQWHGLGQGFWGESPTTPKLYWCKDWPQGLRDQRHRLEALPLGLQALLIDDPDFTPSSLPETRALAQLMGVA